MFSLKVAKIAKNTFQRQESLSKIMTWLLKKKKLSFYWTKLYQSWERKVFSRPRNVHGISFSYNFN